MKNHNVIFADLSDVALAKLEAGIQFWSFPQGPLPARRAYSPEGG